MRRETAPPDGVVARIAANQHGVVSFAQLIEGGLSPSGIRRRVAAGRLHPVHRGVYAVGHRGLSHEGTWMAATLACGEGAALSHRSAVELWRMLKPLGGPSHVILAGAGGRTRRDDIVRHRSRTLASGDLTIENEIPVTRPQRTLEDFAVRATPGELRRALREAEFLRLPVTPGALVDDRAGNELELMLLKACRRARLPTPETNVLVLSYEVDFLWREHRLIVETDGYQAHQGSVAFSEDRRRDARLVAAGYTVLRFSYDQVRYERPWVMATIQKQLERCGL